MGLCDLCKITLENGKKMIIKKCPTCNRDLEEITDDNGVFIDEAMKAHTDNIAKSLADFLPLCEPGADVKTCFEIV